MVNGLILERIISEHSDTIHIVDPGSDTSQSDTAPVDSQHDPARRP